MEAERESLLYLSVFNPYKYGNGTGENPFYLESGGNKYYKNSGKSGWNRAKNTVKGTVKSAFEIDGTVIRNGNVSADMRKFTEYIFKDGAAPGKDVVYKNLGYSMENSEALTKNYIEQAMTKYKNGQYKINGEPTQYGQKINIEIELPGIGDAAGNTSYLKSGWMIRPDGSITLNTPFSGFTK